MRCIECCLICGNRVPPFAITPVLEDENGDLNNCCESCADEQFPGWRDEEDDEDDEDDGV